MHGTPRSRLVPLALALIAAACGGAPRSSPPPPRPAAVERADRDFESRAILLLLADRRMFEERSLVTMLDGSPAVRRELAVALGRIGDARGRAMLQGLLIDAEVEVRRAAAFALGELGAVEARHALAVATVDDDHEVGALAVEALGKLATPLAEVRRPLGALASDEALARLAPFLFRFKEPDAVAAAREALGSADPGVRRGAVYALGRNASPEGLELLRAATTADDPFARAWAARGLGDVGALDDLARLAPLLDDASDPVRIQTLRAGARLMGRFEALPPLGWGERISGLISDSAPGVRATALEAAGSFLPQPELEGSLRRARASGEPRERELALAALVAGGVGDARELAEAAAREDDRHLRAAAAGAAGQLGMTDLLRALARDPAPLVRIAALGAGDPADGPELALAALEDPDPAVRATALDRLAEAPELSTARVTELIDRARADGAENDVRRTGIDVLERRAKADPRGEHAAATAALGRLAADDPDWLVRRAAADALAGLGEPRPEVGAVDTGRSLATYREIVRQTGRPVRVAVETERGDLTLELACPEAPLTCLSFLQLVRAGFYDGVAFHRVVPDFVVQGGDPRGDGWGGPGYSLRDEINRLRYTRGAVGMALSGPDTGGSQFFVTLAPQPHLDGGFTVFGRVVGGDPVLDTIRQGDRIVRARELAPAGGEPVR